ncbi:MAG: YceI family protein, partial [Acidobacteria bacterium]|nr:YceI family protein [Acidobacteriota bacterium]
VRHMMVTNVRGQFSGLKGTISFDPNNLPASKVDATIKAGSLNTGIVKRDDHLRSADFFDIAKFPMLSFKSTKWSREGGRVKVTGDLTMHGVTKSVVFDVEGPAPDVESPDGTIRTGATVTGKINRQDFGLNWNRVIEGGGLTVSEEVAITLDIEAIRK